MQTNIIQLYPETDICPIRPKHYFELYWHTKTAGQMCISSYDFDRIKRQMLSLAKRHIEASLCRDGEVIGSVKTVKNIPVQCTIVDFGMAE